MKEDQQIQIPPLKKSLCRFYLRGLCILPKQECRFSHGIDDLLYECWQEGEEVQFDYLQDTAFCQKKAIKGPRNYYNLYDFQPVKKYTLQQLNYQRSMRTEVRNQMHKQLFEDFIELLHEKYQGILLTQDLLVREYTRVGFNKLMTRIKFSHLTTALCQNDSPKYFMKSFIMPPLLKSQQNYIIRRADEQTILASYREVYTSIMKESEQSLEEGIIKKKLFQTKFPSIHIPPLNQILKERKIGFTDFLEVLNGGCINEVANKIKLDPTVEQITACALEYLLQEACNHPVTWTELSTFLSKTLKINNGNIINQIKPFLVLQGFLFLYFPMLQLITKESVNYPYEAERLSICKCEYKEMYDLSQWELEMQKDVELEEGESVDVNNWQSLIKYAHLILDSKILAVDLEGNLRKGGRVEMVQLNNSHNTFLIDFHLLSVNQDHTTISLAKKILRNTMANPQILKVFHDCRHDSLALHEMLDTCIVNIFDTSANETLKGQIAAYFSIQNEQNTKIAKAKTVIVECSNVRTPGLNDIYSRYNASHGINKHKERFHKMWSWGDTQIFLKRPMDPDYREYCIKDVLDLPEVYNSMSKSTSKYLLEMGQWISAQYVYYGFLSTSKVNEN